MAIIFAALLITMSVGGYITEKSIINPVTIFSGLWAVVIFFSSLGFYTMQVAANSTYIWFFTGTFAFALGYYFNKLFLNKYRFVVGKKTDARSKEIVIPRYRILYVLTTICIVFSLFNWVNLIRQAGTLNLGVIQSMLQSGEYESNNSSVLSAISVLIVSPISFAIPAITASDFWFGKRDKKLLGLTIFMTVINMLSTANRTTFMMLIIFLVLTSYIKMEEKGDWFVKTQKQRRGRIKKSIKYLIAFGVVAFAIMTMSRGSKIFRNIYLNIAMSPRMFEIWADRVEEQHIYGYGTASLLGGFYSVFYVLKNMLGLNSIPKLIQSMYDWMMLTDKQWVWPGDKIIANAYVSLFWFFYVDARQIGIIIGSFVFGIIASRSYLRAVSRLHNAKTVTYYCMIFYAILFSFVRMQFALSKYVLAIFFILNIAYKNIWLIGDKREDLIK